MSEKFGEQPEEAPEQSDIDIYDKITPETLETMGRFSNKVLKKEDIELGENNFEKLIEKHGAVFQKALGELLDLWETKEHRETLGHDRVHISYDLLEFLYLAENGGLSKSEKYMVLFGSLLHDLGRYPELLFQERSGAMDFKKGKQIQLHAALSGYMGALFSKKYKTKETDPEVIEVSKAFDRRVIGAVLFHGGTNEERDPVAHHVQSVDRLAGIFGSREFVRNVVTDGVQRGASFYPDERLSYDKTFPLFNNLPVEKFSNSENPKNSWTNIVHYIEMPLRNMFTLSTQYGMERSKTMKRESGIILALLSGGKDAPLYKQTFAPELDPSGEYVFPKTRIPADIWQEIECGPNKEEKLAMEQYKDLNFHELIDLMLAQQAFDMPLAARKKVYKLIEQVPQEHQKDVRSTIEYVIARRFINQEKERQFLLEEEKSPDVLISTIAGHLLKNKLFSSEEK